MSKQKFENTSLDEPQRRSYKAFFYGSHLMMERVERALGERHVETAAEYDVLYTLYEVPEGTLTIREIAANITLSHSGLSRLLDRLEKRGYVTRCAVEKDKRAVAVQLTDIGRSRVDELWEIISATVQEHFAQSLTLEEHLELARLMGKILPALIEAKENETKLPFIHRV